MQSRKHSAIEALQNIALGMGVAFAAQLFWFPMIGKEFTLMDNIMTTVFFTAVSFVRQYAIRRYHNAKLKREIRWNHS